MRKNQKGFTLIELMIVVAIIGILAAIAIPKFAEMLEKSRDGATKGNIGAVKSAIAIYYGDHEGMWPTDLTAPNPTGVDWNFKSKYMDDIPPVKSTGASTLNAANKGFGPGKTAANKDVYYLQMTGTPSLGASATVGYGYRYDLIGNQGLIWVNSTLLDMATKPYTVYGYE